MRIHWLAFACATAAFGQSFEASVSGGQAVLPSKSSNLGTYTSDPNSGTYYMRDGFRIALRMTINQWRFMGHEIGYAYNHTSIDVPPAALGGTGVPGPPGPSPIPSGSTNYGVPGHQGFYNFLVYAAPEGFRVRPFATGGVQFTAFSTPGNYYDRETKYGVNYGAGVKVKVLENWGIRLDVRQYNMGKPFNLPNASGRLLLWEVSGGFSFLL